MYGDEQDRGEEAFDGRAAVAAPVVARGLVVSLFAIVVVSLVPWTLWLVRTLPSQHVSHHSNLAWAGFDVALTAALAATAITALRRSAWLEASAAAAGTLLLVDAWFDVLTAANGTELIGALATALLAELSLAVLSFLVARHGQRACDYALRSLATPTRGLLARRQSWA